MEYQEELTKLLRKLREGEVIRMYKQRMFYRIQKNETMAYVNARPTAIGGTPEMVENIKLTAICSMTEAELLIENLLK